MASQFGRALEKVGKLASTSAKTTLAVQRATAITAKKKQGATGITTVAPYIAGQWGRGNNRLF